MSLRGRSRSLAEWRLKRRMAGHKLLRAFAKAGLSRVALEHLAIAAARPRLLVYEDVVSREDLETWFAGSLERG